MPPRPRLILIGTSGYSYPWNEGGSEPLQWYVRQGFNSVEINGTFYRFPRRMQAKAWARVPQAFKFSVKVHRSITHLYKLGPNALAATDRFLKALQPLLFKLEFLLFQLPPSIRYEARMLHRLGELVALHRLAGRAVVEFRHPSWWEHAREVQEAGAIFCSVDAPALPRDIINSNGTVYLRLHGREAWYAYEYSEAELREIWARALAASPERLAIYLNNDHGMLPNAKRLLEFMRRLASTSSQDDPLPKGDGGGRPRVPAQFGGQGRMRVI